MTQMGGEDSPSLMLTSHDYCNLALLVTRKMFAFIQRPACEFPVDIVIVGSGEDIVEVCSITDVGELRNWNSTGTLLTARFPIKVSITDAKGYCDTFAVEPDDLTANQVTDAPP